MKKSCFGRRTAIGSVILATIAIAGFTIYGVTCMVIINSAATAVAHNTTHHSDVHNRDAVCSDLTSGKALGVFLGCAFSLILVSAVVSTVRKLMPYRYNMLTSACVAPLMCAPKKQPREDMQQRNAQ